MIAARPDIVLEDCAGEAAAAKLSALAHPARLAILRQLSCTTDCCCKEVVEGLDLAQSTVSQHLKILVEAGLVRFAPDRRRSRYSIDREAVAELADVLNTFLRSCSGRC
jgi:ArsR family transcriptional regulator, arsenate/arsenite/antimonite-responsive transcriptional repressor